MGLVSIPQAQTKHLLCLQALKNVVAEICKREHPEGFQQFLQRLAGPVALQAPFSVSEKRSCTCWPEG